MSTPLPAHDAEVVSTHLGTIEQSLVKVREALGGGNGETLAKHLGEIVYAARQAEARTHQALMLTERFWRP